jgi:hypothetical protein
LKPGGNYIKCSHGTDNLFHKRKCGMKNTLTQIALLTTKVNRQHIQMAFAILALAMLVLGIGAPTDGGANPH